MKNLISISFISLAVFLLTFNSCKNKTISGNISFFEVPLVCGAAPEIGCGSRIKPFFLDTEKEKKIKESWSNRQGTIIAIVWADDFKDEKQREDLIQSLFKKHDIEAELISDEKVIAEQNISLKKDKWYKGMDVDQLSLEEAGVIANEMVTFAKGKSMLNTQQADSIKTEIENYFKGELVKVRTMDELGSQTTRDKWRAEVGQLVSKYIGKEKTEALSVAYMAYREEIEKTQESCCKEDKKDCCKKPEKSTTSEITCPKCGHKEIETLPTEVCQIRYTCKSCNAVLYPKEGDCCVFCTYGDHKCPSKQ